MIFGVAAEFGDAGKLVEAARAVQHHGFHKIETYTPYPVRELDDLVKGFNPLPAIVFAGGALGAATAWILQYYVAAIEYPTNVGGRPLYSWPAFIVITFELTVLFAACAAFFGMLLLAGLPRPNFPMFGVPGFGAASKNRFFLCVEARSEVFDARRVAEVLESCDPIEVWDVENS